MKYGRTRILAGMLAAVLLLSSMAGCSKTSGDSKPQPGKEEDKTSLTVATMSETPSVGPYDHNAVAGSYVNSLVFATLFRTDENLVPEPWLVDSYESASDTEWIMHLKKNVKFHDGTPLTAEDVVASLALAKKSPEVSFYTGSVAKAEAVSTDTVKITTPAPSATLLYDLCHHGNAIVPKKLIDSGNDFGKNPIGAGPYVFKSWTRGDNIVFEAFEEYFMGAPAIKKIVWKTIPEGSSRTIALEANEVDMVIEVEAMDADRIKKNDKLTLLEHDATSVSWLMLNNEKNGLNNELVRKAINAAINKENVVTVALNHLGSPLVSQAPQGMFGSTNEKAQRYDVEQAKKWMKESGVKPESVKLSIICSSDQKKRAAEVIQADLAQLGIAAQIESMDLATYLSTTAEGNFTGAIGGYSASDMVAYLQGVFHSSSINASNKSRLKNDGVDALINEATKTVDEGKRKKLLEDCITNLNSLCPQVPLWQDVYLRAFQKNVKGVKINAGGEIRFENISKE